MQGRLLDAGPCLNVLVFHCLRLFHSLLDCRSLVGNVARRGISLAQQATSAIRGVVAVQFWLTRRAIYYIEKTRGRIEAATIQANNVGREDVPAARQVTLGIRDSYMVALFEASQDAWSSWKSAQCGKQWRDM